ncbi:MAG TPA: hypothetical protein PKV27_07035, partial [Ilumatobacteraceae bacterium]|nr:hypothetical protein [Ilumatobacteraceae bacterium]
MKRRNWIGALFSALLVVGAAGVGPSTAAATDTTTGTYAATTDSSATATTDSTAVPVVTTEAITTEAATTAALPSEPAGQAAQNANSASAGTEPPVSEATAEPSTDPTVAASPTPVEEKTLSVGAKPAPPTIAVTVTAGDFIAGNNGNGLWKIQVSNPSELSFTGPIEATVTVPAPQVIDTNVGSIGWRCTGVGTNVATCTLNTALSAGTPAPLLQLPVVLPKGVAGTTTVDVDVSATTGAQPATVSASQSGSASIKPAIDNPVEPVDPSSGVDLGVDAPYTKALVGESYRQMVYVYNEGDVASTGPTTVTIAANGTTISSVTATGWTCVTDAAQATATCTHPNGIPAGGELPPIALDTMNVGFVGSHVSTIPERLRFDVVVSSPDTDVYPRDNTTVALPLVLLQTNLQLIKEGPAQAAPGARVSYALTPLEINEATLLPIVIEDTLPVGATWVPTPDERWSCVLDAAAGPAGTVRCTYQGSLRQSVWLSITVDLAEQV